MWAGEHQKTGPGALLRGKDEIIEGDLRLGGAIQAALDGQNGYTGYLPGQRSH